MRQGIIEIAGKWRLNKKVNAVKYNLMVEICYKDMLDVLSNNTNFETILQITDEKARSYPGVGS